MSKKKVSLDIGKNHYKVFEMMSWWNTEDVKQAKIMVVGAGALGNEILKNLALLGVGNVLIVDFDTIEYSNLCRSVLFRESDVKTKSLKAQTAAKRIKELNPAIRCQVINGDIMLDVGLGVFRRMDVVIGGLDNRLARLFINRHCHKVNKTWVDGAIENLAGQLNVYTPGTSCYECELNDADRANIKVKMSCPDVAKRNSNVGRIPTTPISSSIIAAMQVQEALKIIHDNKEKSMAGQRFFYEGMNNFFFLYKSAPIQEDCMAHFLYDPITEAPELSANMTIEAALKWMRETLEDENPKIELDYEIILAMGGKNSEEIHEIVVPQPHLSDEILATFNLSSDDQLMIHKDTNIIDKDFPRKDLTLKEVGVPFLHILRVITEADMHFIELTGDEAFLSFQ
ncbi:MAG: ThiF family adenylyltransferase [Bacteroidota bacterium]